MIRLRDRLRRVRNVVRERCSDDSSKYEMAGSIRFTGPVLHGIGNEINAHACCTPSGR